MSREIESVILNLTINKSPGPEKFTGEFYLTFKELVSVPLKLFQNTEEKRILSNSFYKVGITLIPKPDTDTTRK